MARDDARTAAPLGKRVAVKLVEGLIERDLGRTFRRVVWVGPEPWHGAGATLAPDRPLVIYTNHHSFHDGYFLWLLARRVLDRPPLLWMNEWERTPLFGPLGALPFPLDDPAQRLATIRETARRLRDRPEHAFLYFPEGELGPPDAGVAEFSPSAFSRLAKLLPDETQWWPVGIRVTWWGEDRPTVLLGGSAPHDAPDGGERDRLRHAIDTLCSTQPGSGRTLVEGRPSAHERWDLGRLAPLLRRWT
ncbi:MAG: acyltransferase [Rhodothermales bacterium]